MKSFLTAIVFTPFVFFVSVFLVATSYFILTGQSFMYDSTGDRWALLLLMMFATGFGGIGAASFINTV